MFEMDFSVFRVNTRARKVDPSEENMFVTISSGFFYQLENGHEWISSWKPQQLVIYVLRLWKCPHIYVLSEFYLCWVSSFYHLQLALCKRQTRLSLKCLWHSNLRKIHFVRFTKFCSNILSIQHTKICCISASRITHNTI